MSPTFENAATKSVDVNGTRLYTANSASPAAFPW